MFCVLYAFVCIRVIHQTLNFTPYNFFLLLSLHVHPNHLYRLALDCVDGLFFGPIYIYCESQPISQQLVAGVHEFHQNFSLISLFDYYIE